MNRLIFKTALVAVLTLFFTRPVMAQEDELKDLPGYVDFGNLAATYGEPKITINLGGSMLNFVSAMTKSDDPETSQMISKLKGIRVQVFSTENIEGAANLDSTMNKFQSVSKSLKSSGWEPIVQINEDDERVLVYMKMQSGNMEGMTVMVVDNEEAVFVNVIGQLNPDELGRVMDTFDVDVDVKVD
jgi:HSP20 family molecular chaperone IbpA